MEMQYSVIIRKLEKRDCALQARERLFDTKVHLAPITHLKQHLLDILNHALCLALGFLRLECCAEMVHNVLFNFCCFQFEIDFLFDIFLFFDFYLYKFVSINAR